MTLRQSILLIAIGSIICILSILVLRKFAKHDTRNHSNNNENSIAKRQSSNSVQSYATESEACVANILNEIQSGVDYFKIVNNLIIQYGKDKTTEIDFIVLSRAGIFVIEVKGWRGIVRGYEDSEYFATIMGRNYDKNSEKRNPIIQNQKHINTLKARLNIHNVDMYNCVVFTNAESIEVDSPHVFSLTDFKDYILNTSRELKYSREQMEQYKRILDTIKKNQPTRERHIESIRHNHPNAQ